MSQKLLDAAPQILAEIEKVDKILLHSHPSPDPDSIGSTMGLFLLLKKMGKHPTLIIGDSVAPSWLKFLPGTDQIVQKNYFEINPAEFELFLILDAGGLEQISKKGEIKFPENLKTIAIDHHISNPGYAEINLIDPSYPSAAAMVADLIKVWGMEPDQDMALNLIMGIYSDTGGFKFPPTDSQTFETMAWLVKYAPDYHRTIFEYENSLDPGRVKYLGLALSNIQLLAGGRVAITLVSNQQLKQAGLAIADSERSPVPNMLISVVGWEIGIGVCEREVGVFSLSFRTRDPQKFDVAKIAAATGEGGGHKAAAGATIRKPLTEVVDEIKRVLGLVYPELKDD